MCPGLLGNLICMEGIEETEKGKEVKEIEKDLGAEMVVCMLFLFLIILPAAVD